MTLPQAVLDTNLLVSGLRSRRGAAFQLLERVGTGKFDIHLSVPLLFEYEDVLGRQVAVARVGQGTVDAVLDYHRLVVEHHRR